MNKLLNEKRSKLPNELRNCLWEIGANVARAEDEKELGTCTDGQLATFFECIFLIMGGKFTETRLTKLHEFATDVKEHGLRADLNPTIKWPDISFAHDENRLLVLKALEEFGETYTAYLKRLDTNIRDRAEHALKQGK